MHENGDDQILMNDVFEDETFEEWNILINMKYSVDKLCAVRELRMIGVHIPEEYEKQLQQSVESVRKQRLASKLKRDKESNSSSLFDSDENFAYIIGYTSGGAPYGVTHEEMNIENQSDYLCSSVRNLLGDKSDPELYSLKFGKS